MGRAGIVLGIEMSRLARTGRDWHLLLELCCLGRFTAASRLPGGVVCDIIWYRKGRPPVRPAELPHRVRVPAARAAGG